MLKWHIQQTVQKHIKKIADFGIGNFIFRNRKEYIDFAKKMELQSPRDLVEIKVAKPYNHRFTKNIFRLVKNQC